MTAGFTEAHVYENLTNKDPSKGPYFENSIPRQLNQFQLGQKTLAYYGLDYIANYVNVEKESASFTLPWRNVIFIAGDTDLTPFDLPATRRLEFRKLILVNKPAHIIAVLYINYT